MTHAATTFFQRPLVRFGLRVVVSITALVGVTACGNDDEPAGPGGGVVSVEVHPATLFLEVGATAPLQFFGRKADDTVVGDLTPKWTVSDASKASVSTAGVVTATSVGSAQITASIGSYKATSTLTTVVGQRPVKTWGLDVQGLTEVSLLAVWAASPTSVFTGGQDGTILRWTGGGWSTMAVPTRETIVGLWGTSESNVFAVGTNGLVLHYDGATWTPMASGTSNTLLEVWGLDATHVYAAGAGGAMLRFDGTQWSPMTNNGGNTEIWGLWGWSPTNLVAVGQNGAILRYDGTAWTTMPSVGAGALFGVWGAAPNDAYAVGTDGVVLHFDGAT